MTTPAKNAKDLTPNFNFDAWEREVELAPYIIVIGGKPYTAMDVLDIDYREFNRAQKSDDDEEMFKLMFPKDHEKILATRVIKVGAMDKFTDDILSYYGLGPTEDSEDSSGGTATR